MVQEVEMTKEEQIKMYMKSSKKELCEMLIEANKHLKKQLTLTDVGVPKGGQLPKRLSNEAYNVARMLTYEGFVEWWDSQGN